MDQWRSTQLNGIVEPLKRSRQSCGKRTLARRSVREKSGRSKRTDSGRTSSVKRPFKGPNSAGLSWVMMPRRRIAFVKRPRMAVVAVAVAVQDPRHGGGAGVGVLFNAGGAEAPLGKSEASALLLPRRGITALSTGNEVPAPGERDQLAQSSGKAWLTRIVDETGTGSSSRIEIGIVIAIVLDPIKAGMEMDRRRQQARGASRDPPPLDPPRSVVGDLLMTRRTFLSHLLLDHFLEPDTVHALPMRISLTTTWKPDPMRSFARKPAGMYCVLFSVYDVDDAKYAFCSPV